MSVNFVLVHGAWHGGWVWQRVAPLLRKAGHEVHAPTLTGVSDRAHLLHPGVGLSTHVTDVVSLISAYDLTDVVLVGHSYGGQVITGVADVLPDRVAKRVYLDAFAGDSGEAAVELQPSDIAGHYRHSVAEQGFGWLIPVRSLAKMGVTDPADVEWLAPRLTPHPWLSFTEKLSLSGAVSSVPAEFIECVGWMRVFRGMRERAESRGWPVHEIATGHEAMVTAPAELASLLVKIAA